MEMQVIVPVVPPPPPPADFNFDSTCSSPYMTAPSSPQRFGNFFFSAPASPTRISAFYRNFNDASSSSSATNSSSTAIPFDWEDKPGTPKSKRRSVKETNIEDNEEDFEFNFSGQLERTSLSADELFDGGKIRPLKPPPGYDSAASTAASSPRSPRSSRTGNKKDIDPFQAALDKARQEKDSNVVFKDRGRVRTSSAGSSWSASVPPKTLRKGTRSLSPLRVSDIMLSEDERNDTRQNNAKMISKQQQEEEEEEEEANNSKSWSSFLSAISFSKGYYRKWKLKDFLLFRSASEGRPTGKGPLMTKYAVLSKKEVVEDTKNASFRSTDSGGSSRRRGPPLSAHEVHYTMNRAVSEELKRKTFLPYKQGLLGCLGFSPGGVHDISVRGVGSMPRG